MGCEAALMEQDQWLAGQLTAGPALELQGETLTLRNGGTEIVLVDEQVGGASAAAPLEGTEWVLDTLFEGESASSVPAGVTATIRIDGSTLTVNDGCNSGGGNVVVEGSRLRIGDLVTTQKACGEEATRVERHLLAVLGASPSFTVEADQLRLDTGTGRGVGFRSS
jgi:heat shock protein HslJ